MVAGVAADAFGNIVDTADSAMGIGLSKKTFAKKLVKKTGKEMAKEAVRTEAKNPHKVAIGVDAEGRFVLSDAPEAASTRELERVRRDSGGALAAPGSPERSRSPLPSSMSYSALKQKEDAPVPPPKQPQPQPPPRPNTLPPQQPLPVRTPEVAPPRQGNARFTDEEVAAMLALAPTPTHETIQHALDLPMEREGRRAEAPSTNIYPKI